MTFQILEVLNNKDLDRFIRFPLSLYRESKYYVPPFHKNERISFDPTKNPAFRDCEATCWLAIKEGRVIGRIGGIINHRYNELSGRKSLRFNWFDCIEDMDVAGALFRQVETWGREKGMTVSTGPYGFTSFDRHGMLVEGFDEMPVSSSNYNFPYYPEFMQRLGYEKEMEFLEYEITVPQQIPEKVEKIARIALERNKLHLIQASRMKELMPYKYKMFHLLNEAYSHLLGVAALSDELIDFYVGKFFGFLNPDYLSVVVNEQDQVVAFAIAVPSLSRARQKARGKLFPLGYYYLWRALKVNDTIDFLLIAVKPELQNKGINSILLSQLNPRYVDHGIRYVETTQNQSDNIKVQAQYQYYKNRQHKRSCLFKKPIV